MTQYKLIGIDTSKAVFTLHGLDHQDRPVLRINLRRPQLLAFFKRLPSTKIAMEACACAHYWARELMAQGAPLVHRVPGRMGWELRLVVQGGLRILDKIEALGFDTFSQRPTIGKLDAPVLLWKAMRMRRQLRPMKAAPPR